MSSFVLPLDCKLLERNDGLVFSEFYIKGPQ